jgi:YD repeat-containing protein
MGNAIEMIYPDGSKIKQSYDIAGRLKIYTNKRNQSIHYSYDGDTYNDLNQLEVSGTHTYQYDADGNLVEEKDPVSGETRKCYYDSESRLTGYEK